jgi:two-component system OmpR family sensor kinase
VTAPQSPRWSIATRLTRQLVLGLCALWLVAVGAAGLLLQAELDEVFDGALAETAQHMLDDIVHRQGDRLAALRPEDPAIVPATSPHQEYMTYHLVGPDGRVLMRSHDAAPVAWMTLPRAPAIDDTGGTRAAVEATVDGRYRLRLAEPADHRRHTIRATTLRLLLPMIGLIGATLLLVPPLVRRSLRPVARLQTELGRRGGDNMEPIGSLGLPAELRPIRDDVNKLLERLGRAMEVEHRFAANAAHELRTPIAAALAQAQLLGTTLAADQAGAEQAAAITAELWRLGRRIEKLLQLGRAEAGVALRPVATDLLVPLHLLAEEHGPRARIIIEDGGLESLLVRADGDVLAIALRNLLENAVLHGDPAQPVLVRVTADGVVRVTNAGPRLTPARLAQLGTPFVRSGSAGGHGLGLSIVRSIAAQLGGTLTLHSPAPGRANGFAAELTLPLWRTSEEGSQPRSNAVQA